MTGWDRENWTRAQINLRCSELERDLASIHADHELTRFQVSVLCHMVIEAAAADLVQYDWFRSVA